MATKISNEELSEKRAKGCTLVEIADQYGMALDTVVRRARKLDKTAPVKRPRKTLRTAASVWDTRKAAEENYRRLLLVLENDCESPADKVRTLGEIRQYMAFVLHIREALHSMQETDAFVDEVLDVIEEVDPIVRDTIISRLREKRPMRAAAQDVGRQASGTESAVLDFAVGSLDSDEGGCADAAPDYTI